MKYSALELAVGTLVLAGLAAIAFFALSIGGGTLIGRDTYLVKARFTNTGGLKPGANVAVAGVSVGRVEAVDLDDAFAAIVSLRLRGAVKLPEDTIASIRTSGLIGDKFIALAPGGALDDLAPGDLIVETESAVDLESLISRFAFGNVDSANTPAANDQPATP
ncbi:MAG: outer membrane lipid asymmetry maintenance protein MlaD [Verrucomicrobiota bacterium]